jgi:hypothetical protein
MPGPVVLSKNAPVFAPLSYYPRKLVGIDMCVQPSYGGGLAARFHWT